MAYIPATWRLLHSSFADGPTNMAIDEAILLSVAAGQGSPTLRFFGWMPPCLSLGYAQSLADVAQDRLQTLGWGLVRRPTGGRAILHTDELTYSVIAPVQEPRVQGGVMESYRHLSAGLLRGLAALGVSAQADRMRLRGDRRDRTVAPVCFEQPSHYEITWQGKKLLGSAQMRKAGMVLQHGTLPLAGDIARIGEALHFETEEQREQAKIRVRQRATTLAEVLGRAVSWEAAAQALAQGLAEMLNLTLQPGRLTEAEQALATRLRAEKYATPAWNLGAGRLPASPALDA